MVKVSAMDCRVALPWCLLDGHRAHLSGRICVLKAYFEVKCLVLSKWPLFTLGCRLLRAERAILGGRHR